MGLILDWYQARCGAIAQYGWLCISDLLINHETNMANFSFSVYTSQATYEEGRIPLDKDITNGWLPLSEDYPEENIEELATEILFQKIQQVKGLTQQECDILNQNFDIDDPLAWVNYYDIELQQLSSARHVDDPEPVWEYIPGHEHDDEIGPEDPNA